MIQERSISFFVVHIKSGGQSPESFDYPQNQMKTIIDVIIPAHYNTLNLRFLFDDNGLIVDHAKEISLHVSFSFASCMLNL